MKRTRLSVAESYKHYLNEIENLKSKYQASDMPIKDVTPLTQNQYKLAFTTQVNAAKMKGQHHPGSARIAEKIARETAFDATDKETRVWEKAMRDLGISDVPSRKSMKYHGMPSALKDAIDRIKDQNPGLSSSALSALIGTQIFGSL